MFGDCDKHSSIIAVFISPKTIIKGEIMKINKMGFSLLELLVVILIVGVLAAIALPQYRSAVDRARYSTMMDIARALAEANERYYMVHDVYSTTYNDLDIDIPAKSISGQSAFFDWGECQIYFQRGVFCSNNKNLQNQIMIWYTFGDSYHNKMTCMAKGSDRNSRWAKVCEGFGTYWQTTSCEIIGKCSLYKIR